MGRQQFLRTITVLPVGDIEQSVAWYRRALGFETGAGARVLIHSIIGCAFYGAFATKVIAVRDHDQPRWVLPVIGGTVFSLLVVIWLTSSLWFFTNVEFPGF